MLLPRAGIHLCVKLLSEVNRDKGLGYLRIGRLVEDGIVNCSRICIACEKLSNHCPTRPICGFRMKLHHGSDREMRLKKTS